MQLPAKAQLWSNCALSTSGRGYRSTGGTKQSDSRLEAAAAYWLAREVMFAGLAWADVQLGMKAPNGWAIDAEMIGHTVAFCEYVEGFNGHRLESDVMKLGDHIAGPSNHVICLVVGGIVHVIGYKYGWRVVEVEENAELMCVGVSMSMAISGGPHPIRLHVYQPRPYHPEGIARTWDIQAHDVMFWGQRLVSWAADAEGMDHAPQGTPGAHCRDCDGRASCHALAASVYAMHDTVTDGRMGQMSPVQLAAELDFLERAQEMLKARIAGVEAEAESRIGSEFIPGWEMATKTGQRVWTNAPGQRQVILGILPFKSVEMSPAEMERAGASKELVKGMTTNPPKGSELRRVNLKAIKKVFGGT
jgi:hypothetical protein